MPIKESNKSLLQPLSINSILFKSSNSIELSLASNLASIRALNLESLLLLELISLNISSSSSSSLSFSSSSTGGKQGFGVKKAVRDYCLFCVIFKGFCKGL